MKGKTWKILTQIGAPTWFNNLNLDTFSGQGHQKWWGQWGYGPTCPFIRGEGHGGDKHIRGGDNVGRYLEFFGSQKLFSLVFFFIIV